MGDAPHHFQKVRTGTIPTIPPGLCRLVTGPVNHHATAVRPLADPVVDVVEGRDQLGGFVRCRHGGGQNRRGCYQGRRSPSIRMHRCPFPLARRGGDCEEERLPAADLTFRPPFADHPVHWLAVCRIPSRLRDSARFSRASVFLFVETSGDYTLPLPRRQARFHTLSNAPTIAPASVHHTHPHRPGTHPRCQRHPIGVHP